jgi:multidrug resistance efflux pump
VESFAGTRRFLRRQRLRQQAGIVGVLVVLFGGWFVWLCEGRVSLYVTSHRARLEVETEPVPVQCAVDGQVTFTDVHLGRQVVEGETILKLDAEPLRLRRAELDVAVRSGMVSLAALRSDLAVEEDALEAARRMASATSRTAAARVSLDKESLAFKERESEIAARLHEATAMSALDALYSMAGAETQKAQVHAASAQAVLDTRASAMTVRDHDSRLATVRISVAQSEAEIAKWKAQIDTLNYDIARRSVRASATGVLADALPISVGMTLTADVRVATILPAGRLRVVAHFLPEESVGRVHIGQVAKLRLDNFPWTQYGTVAAAVAHVAQEPRDGWIRVELSITEPNAAIPMEHGLTGRCEIEVEQTSPMRVLLRSVTELTPPRADGDRPNSPIARGSRLESEEL